MNTSTPSEIASWLRTIADDLERSAPAPLTVYLSLSVSWYETTLSEDERVAAVDAVASALGTKAGPSKVASAWEHSGQRGDGPHHVAVRTRIEGPQLCACGTACTHGRQSAC